LLLGNAEDIHTATLQTYPGKEIAADSRMLRNTGLGWWCI